VAPHATHPPLPARFDDRHDAGRQLAAKLRHFAGRDDVLVLALPRGGVPVAEEVALALGAPLDVFLVRKIGLPGHEEFAMGAIASGGTVMMNPHVTRTYGVSEQAITRAVEKERSELERRELAYREGRPAAELRDRTVILVDDGLATGSSMRVAVEAVREHKPRGIVIAVPIAPPETCEALAKEVDEVVCAVTPEPFYAVGLWYKDFEQTTDEEVKRILEKTRAPAVGAKTNSPRGASGESRATSGESRSVRIPAGEVTLEGDLEVPAGARGVVIFAHGSGSSRKSGRNRAVAAALRESALATLLMDLLTADEEAIDMRTAHLRFDIPMLARRLVSAAEWARAEGSISDLPIGMFGASTGGGAALIAAADRADLVAAVVSRGGRPDLAGEALPRVKAPTLLLVGGRDHTVIELNEQARAQMTAPVELIIVPGATHLFEEPGTLEQVAALARRWFERHLARASASS
jgi:putative phosphoribosyl transferase